MTAMREMMDELIAAAMREGASFAEVRCGSGQSLSVRAEDGCVRRVSVHRGRGCGIRVIVGGAWGFATTDSLQAEQMRQCLEDALAMARAAAPAVEEAAHVAEPEEIVQAESVVQCKIDPAEVALSERVKTIAGIEERARKHHPSIVNTIVNYSDSSGVVELANSFGGYVRWERKRCTLSLMVTAGNEQTRQIAYDARSLPAGWEVVGEMDVEEFAGGVAQRAVDLLSAAEAPAGTMPVILDPEITGLITHEAFGHNCEADLVWAGDSIVAGKEGQQVAAEIVTIVDDPTLPGHNGSFEYDDEGVPARRHVLVKEGVLGEYLHNLETAARFSVRPNGAGRAAGTGRVPLPRMSNTFIEAGEESLEALVADMERGVLLKRARGGYVDTARGHFTFSVETGWEVEKGRLGRQIRNCTLTGYTLETLQKVKGLTREFELKDSGMCGKMGQMVPTSIGGPYMFVAELTVGGQRVGEEG